MRIAYLSGAYIPARGANTMHVMGMCEAMARLGHDVTLYARQGELEIEDDFKFYGVEPVFQISKQTRPQIRGWGALVDAVNTRKTVASGVRPDLIYARETWAMTLAAGLGIPFVYESHWLPRSVIHRAAEARLLRHPQLQRVVFISEALRQMYFNVFPWLDMNKTLIAHDAANTPVVEVGSNDVCLGRGGALQVGYVGSFQVGCGIDLIADIAALRPDDDFHVFGGSPAEVEEWVLRASEIGNLKFHGFIAPSSLSEIYDSMDVMLAPYQATTRSIEWASPMKIFEYMAHSKAIICSDFPVFREVLENKVSALLVPADLPVEWALALVCLGMDEPFRRQLGVASNELLKRDFTWQRRAERILCQTID